MSNTALTERSGNLLVRLIVTVMVVQLIFVGYVFYQSYEGRVSLVDAQRSGCNRGNEDRRANAKGWRIAESARRAEGQYVVANNYRDIAIKLEVHSRIPCNKAYPTPGFLP